MDGNCVYSHIHIIYWLYQFEDITEWILVSDKLQQSVRNFASLLLKLKSHKLNIKINYTGDKGSKCWNITS